MATPPIALFGAVYALLVVASVALPLRPFHGLGRNRLGWTSERSRDQSSAAPRTSTITPNTTRYFHDQRQDHFDEHNTNTWVQRYFVNDTFFDPRQGPVFLCVGGEGPPLEPTVVVTGDLHCAHMITIAAQQKALILALEHRFYGESIPTADFATGSLRFLSSRQALADLQVFHDHIVSTYALAGNKWVTFGGSYPGMLAAWARLKYPSIIHAAVSSSAPVRAEVNFQGYNDVVAASLADPLVGGSPTCAGAVANAFASLGAELGYAYGRRTVEGLLHVCGASALDDVRNQQMLLQALFNFFPAQTNDPACTAPGCNIASVCEIMLDPSHGFSSLGSLSYLVGVVQGAQCLDVSYASYVATLLNTTVAGGVERIWTYETCNEFAFYQTCDPGSQCPFTTHPWLDTLQFSLDLCALAFNISAAQVTESVAATNAYYGADQPNATRILFVNGDIDPWHALSVLEPLSPLLPALVVPGASHHAWTHPAQPTDSAAIVKVRQQITSYVLQWLAMDP